MDLGVLLNPGRARKYVGGQKSSKKIQPSVVILHLRIDGLLTIPCNQVDHLQYTCIEPRVIFFRGLPQNTYPWRGTRETRAVDCTLHCISQTLYEAIFSSLSPTIPFSPRILVSKEGILSPPSILAH